VRPAVYIETTIPSYLTARPSASLPQMARQKATWDWWHGEKARHRCFVSQVVLDEAAVGDAEAAERRAECLAGIPVLETTEEVVRLTRSLVQSGIFPRRAIADYSHLAYAAVFRLDYLLTWNFRHLANAEAQVRLRAIVERAGFAFPVICTPEALMKP
jgi:hypothetical protein